MQYLCISIHQGFKIGIKIFEQANRSNCEYYDCGKCEVVIRFAILLAKEVLGRDIHKQQYSKNSLISQRYLVLILLIVKKRNEWWVKILFRPYQIVTAIWFYKIINSICKMSQFENITINHGIYHFFILISILKLNEQSNRIYVVMVTFVKTFDVILFHIRHKIF